MVGASGPVSDVLDDVARLAGERGRPDLAARLAAASEQLARPHTHVVVAGEFKRGKSALVNALVDVDVCPVDVDLASAVPVLVESGAEHTATVLLADDDDGDGGGTHAESLAAADVGEFASEDRNPGNQKRARAVQVSVPSALLGEGIVLVDTPGVGGLGSGHAEATLAAVALADGVLFVKDASEELTQPELDFLGRAASACPHVACVVTKVDFYPEWRKVVDLDRARLAAAGIDAPVLPASATLHRLARERGDADLDEESGYPAVAAQVRSWAAATSAAAARRRALAEAVSVLAQVESALRAEEEAAAGAAQAEAVVTGLARARERARGVGLTSAEWQHALVDGFRELDADVDQELAARLREVSAEVDAAIDAGDPAEAWDEMVAALERQSAAAVTAARLALAEGVARVAGEVAEQFGTAEAHVTGALTVAAPMLDALAIARRVDQREPGVAAKGMLALQGSWAGVEALGMIGGLVGVGVLNPVAVVIGLFLGRRALADERERRLQARRTQAREAVHRYLDEVAFRAGRDCRQALRRAQKRLREGFAARAAELERTMADALDRAERAAAGGADEARVDRSLARVAELRARALALDPSLAGSGGG